MSIQTEEQSKLLSRVRALVERGERIVTDDVEALFGVSDTSALAHIARIPRERRHGRAAFYTDVIRIAFDAQSAEDLLRRAGAGERPLAIEPVDGADLDALVSAARAIATHRDVVITTTASWIEATAIARSMHIGDILDTLRTGPRVRLTSTDTGALDAPASVDASISLEHWLKIHREAHARGISTSASMTYFTREQPAEYARHLDAVRALQDETGMIEGLVMLPEHRNDLEASYLANPTAHQTLRAVAIARIALDNILHIAVAPSLVTTEVAVVALSYGADTIDTTVRIPSVDLTTDGAMQLPVLVEADSDNGTDGQLVTMRVQEARFTAIAVDSGYTPLVSGETTVGTA